MHEATGAYTGLRVRYTFWRVNLKMLTALCVYAMNYISEYDVEVLYMQT